MHHRDASRHQVRWLLPALPRWEQLERVERRLRGMEGLSFARRKGRVHLGRRTAMRRAVASCRVAVAPEGLVDQDALVDLAASRSRQAPGEPWGREGWRLAIEDLAAVAGRGCQLLGCL